jgi:hypothetical protein
VPELYVVNIDGSGLRQVTPFVYDSNGNPVGAGVYNFAWKSRESTEQCQGVGT